MPGNAAPPKKKGHWQPNPEEREPSPPELSPFEGDDEVEIRETQDVSRAPQSLGVSIAELKRRGDDPSFLQRLAMAPRLAKFPNRPFYGPRPETLHGVWLENNKSKRLGLDQPRFTLLDTPPTALNVRGDQFWKRQTGNHLRLFSRVDICTLGGRAQGLLHRWDFRGGEDPQRMASTLACARMFPSDWQAVESVLKEISRAEAAINPSIYVEASGSGHVGYYSYKVTERTDGGFALAVQLLGTE